MRWGHTIALILLVWMMAACTGNKHLSQGEKFYEGSDIVFQSSDPLEKDDKKETAEDVRDVFRVDPNLKFLGNRPRVWFYHLAGEVKKEKGFKHWLKYKVGEVPVLLSDVDLTTTRNLVANRLETNGFFNPVIEITIDSNAHKAEVIYQAEVKRPFRYDSIFNYTPEAQVTEDISSSLYETKINPGDRYDLELVEAERDRLAHQLRDSGYYYFGDRYILYEMDTTLGNHGINVYPSIKSGMPDRAGRIYSINNISVYENKDWSATDSMALNFDNTTTVQEIEYLSQGRPTFRPEIIADVMTLKPGDLYSREKELTTLNRLIQLETFNFVNLTFSEADSTQLDMEVQLSPRKKKSIRVQVEGVTTSNSFVGPHVTASFLNRNIFRGAERYELNIGTGYEWQIGGGSSQSNYEVSVDNVFTIPRLIQPFNIHYENARFLPETKFRAGARFQRRVKFYQLNSLELGYGFDWKETITKRHVLYPVDIKYIELGRTSGEFDTLLLENPFLARSFEEQFILGSSYSYFFSTRESKANKERAHNYYFNGRIDISGNVLYLTQRLANASTSEATGNYTLFNQPYSQFVRTRLDFRHYWKIHEQHKLASRMIVGVGYSYGNSFTLPYALQFSVGGSSSLRAFRARSVGPGSTNPDSVGSDFVDQTADVKFEINTEYRFPIIGNLEGAVFVDAGNIWTIRFDSTRADGTFKWKRALRQLAVGTGLGVRYDFDFFVLRLDLGVPLHVPYQQFNEQGERVPFRIEILDRNWRKEYLVWNIAIGYPF